MDYSALALVLLIIGLALLFAELFIPSGGLILIVALVCLAGSIWSAWTAWWHTSPIAWWTYLSVLIFALPAIVGFALYYFPKTAVGKRILLDAPSAEEIEPYRSDQDHLSELVGKTGKTLSMLSPGGLMEIEGERMHCESQGIIIDPGEVVEVVAIKGNRLVVRRAPEKEPSPAPPDKPVQQDSLTADADSSGESPLDFDVPRS